MVRLLTGAGMLPLLLVAACGYATNSHTATTTPAIQPSDDLFRSEPFRATNPQEPRRPPRRRAERNGDDYRDDGPPPRNFGRTRVRLMVFREELELADLDVDFGDGGSGGVSDWERERLGFRGEFGRGNAGFFQVFTEDLRSPSLLGANYDLFGLGGGIVGHPTVGRAGPVEMAVPYRWALNMAFGSETVGGFDGDVWYGESVFEVGFAARAYGAQLSSGVVANSIAGWFDSDDPARMSAADNSELTGTNFGAYFEALYKHPRVPLVARARAMVGDVEGFLLTFGFAF